LIPFRLFPLRILNTSSQAICDGQLNIAGLLFDTLGEDIFLYFIIDHLLVALADFNNFFYDLGEITEEKIMMIFITSP